MEYFILSGPIRGTLLQTCKQNNININIDLKGWDNQAEVGNDETLLNASCLKQSTLSWLFKGWKSICFSFMYVWAKVSFIPSVGIYTWKKGWRKTEVRTDLQNHIQHPERDMVSSRMLELFTLHFVLCMRTVAIVTCLLFRYLFIEPFLNTKMTLYFTWYPLPLPLHSIFLSISLGNYIFLQKSKSFKTLFFIHSKTLQIFELLFLLETFLLKEFYFHVFWIEVSLTLKKLKKMKWSRSYWSIYLGGLM